MTEILLIKYDFVEHQHHISAIGFILHWLGKRGFTLVHYSRPISKNVSYPNLEFVAQRKKNFTKSEREEWNHIQTYPSQHLYNTDK